MRKVAPSSLKAATAKSRSLDARDPGFDAPPSIRVFDPGAIEAALDEGDDGVGAQDDWVGPDDERPPVSRRSRSTEDEVWARLMRKILADPRRGLRDLLVGDAAMVDRLREATAALPHFAVVTGIVERAVLTSAATRDPIRFPPVLMLSAPGLGKSHYARVVAGALGTLVVPIALNATSDRGALGGSSPAWRGARMGRLAKALLLDGRSASPLFLLDEIDKASNIAGENVASILLSALEPENARAFVDEYVDVPIRLDHALWLAGANTTATISAPLLSRMLVVEVPMPSREQARTIVRAIARATMTVQLDEDAVDLLSAMSARKIRQAIELAHPYAVCAGRDAVSADDVRRGVALVGGERRRHAGFLSEAAP
jgi:ATP-dependent Lon protease